MIPIFFITLSSFCQIDSEANGLFYKISLATTLGINENFTIGDEDNKNLIRPSAYFINNTLGYQFDERLSIGLNAEYNWHSESGLQFFPVHLGFRYNITGNNDSPFVRGSYGRLIDMGKFFESGTLYKLGVGAQFQLEDSQNSVLIGLDFSRKRFGFRQTEKLSSVSIFIEFMVF